MKTKKETRTGVAHKPVIKDRDVYAKSLGLTRQVEDLYKPLYHSMYK